MKKLSLIFILFSLLLTPTLVFSTTVYNNTTNPLSLNLYSAAGVQIGDEVTLEGSERLVTEFMFGYGNLNGNGNETAHIRFYLNDGQSGQPGSLLLDLGVYPLGIVALGDLTIDGLSILIPGDTFTWTVEWGFEGGISPYFPLYNPPTTGSTKNYLWDKGQVFPWVKNYEGKGYHLKAQIEAEPFPVPEPGILILLGLSMISIVGVRKWWKE